MRTRIPITLFYLICAMCLQSTGWAQGGTGRPSGEFPLHWSVAYQHLTNVTVTPKRKADGVIWGAKVVAEGQVFMTDGEAVERGILKTKSGDAQVHMELIKNVDVGAGFHTLSGEKHYNFNGAQFGGAAEEITVLLDYWVLGSAHVMPGRRDSYFVNPFDSAYDWDSFYFPTGVRLDGSRYNIQGEIGDPFRKAWHRIKYENGSDKAKKITVFYRVFNTWRPFNDTLANPMIAPADSSGLRYSEMVLSDAELFGLGYYADRSIEYKTFMWDDTPPVTPGSGGYGGDNDDGPGGGR